MQQTRQTMKLLTKKFLLTYLILFVNLTSLIAPLPSFSKIFLKNNRKAIDEGILDELAKDVQKLLNENPTKNKLINLQDAIKKAQLLIEENKDKENRSEEVNEQIESALTLVGKLYTELPSKWKKKAFLTGSHAAAVVAGAGLVHYGKDLYNWAFPKSTAKPAALEKVGGAVKIGGLPGGILGQNIGPPKPIAPEPFPWTWVIIGVLVMVAIGMAVYLNQNSLFGDGGGADDYGDEEGESDEPTRKKKKKKRQSNKKRKRRHTI